MTSTRKKNEWGSSLRESPGSLESNSIKVVLYKWEDGQGGNCLIVWGPIND